MNVILPDVLRRDPGASQHALGQQFGQRAGSDAVGHNLGAGDEFDVGRVNHGDRVDVRQQFVVELKGVGRHLQHHGILRGEGVAHPGIHVGKPDALGALGLVEIGIAGSRDEIVLVDVQADVAGGHWCFLRHGTILLG